MGREDGEWIGPAKGRIQQWILSSTMLNFRVLQPEV